MDYFAIHKLCKIITDSIEMIVLCEKDTPEFSELKSEIDNTIDNLKKAIQNKNQ